MPSNNSLRVFSGAVSIITGGASGIGRALAEELAKRGSEVVLADQQKDLAAEAAAAIRNTGGNATAVEVDVTDSHAMERLVSRTVERTGRLDYLFNNAGIGFVGLAAEHTLADWDRIIDINLRGVIHGVHAAAGVMLRQGYGHIVNTSSLAGLTPTPGVTAYSTTKHAVVGLSKGLRAELAPAGVRVSVLCPGFVRTPIIDNCRKEAGMQMDIPPEFERRIWKLTMAMPANRFASKVLDALAKNRPIIVIPAWWKAFWLLNRLSPSFGIVLAEKAFLRIQKDLAEATKPSPTMPE
jgi:NAD(P)-dependent dehydrogenase (short-subunit alcohol dehydrogenase family)